MSNFTKVVYVFIVLSFNYLAFFSTEASAQFTRTSYPYFTQHFLHPFTVNPAFVGDPSKPSVGLGFRSAPRYRNINSSSGFAYVRGAVPALNDGGIGVTFSFNNDEFLETYDRQMHLGLTAAYTFNLADLVELKGGISMGFLKSNSNNFFGMNPGLMNNERKQKLNVDIGVMIEIPYVKIGLAMHHNNQPKFDFYQFATPITYQNELFITIDGDIPIKDIISIKPSLIAQMEREDMLAQFTLMAEYDNMAFLAISYSKDLDFNSSRNTSGFAAIDEYHPLRLTLGGKVARFMLAGTYGVPNVDNRNALFELSLGYFLDDEE